MRPFGSGSSDEDPYSVAGSGSSGGSSGNSGGRVSTNPVPKQSDRPPKLPPRDTPMPKSKIRDIYGPSLWARPAVPALTNLKKTPKKSSGGIFIFFTFDLFSRYHYYSEYRFNSPYNVQYWHINDT